jgi:hypothetical protein
VGEKIPRDDLSEDRQYVKRILPCSRTRYDVQVILRSRYQLQASMAPFVPDLSYQLGDNKDTDPIAVPVLSPSSSYPSVGGLCGRRACRRLQKRGAAQREDRQGLRRGIHFRQSALLQTRCLTGGHVRLLSDGRLQRPCISPY